MLDCSQKPVAPVNWTFRQLPDSYAQHIVTEGSVVSDTDRFGIFGSSLMIYKVQPNDVGSYDCCDAKKDVLTYIVTLGGTEIAYIALIVRNMKCKTTTIDQIQLHHSPVNAKFF